MTLQAQKSLHSIALKANANGVPDYTELTAINQYTIRTHTADEVYARTMYLAHNAIDRDREAIADDLLQQLANTLPGKGFFIKHPTSYDGDSGPGEGRFFHAEIKRISLDEARTALREPDLKFLEGTTEALLLEASFYTVRAGREDLIADIDAGVAGDVSMGFSYAERARVQDADENLQGYRLLAPGKAYEGSLVWLGAQNGARITKQFDNNKSTDDDEENPMELKDALAEIDTLKTSNKSLSADVTKFKTASGKYDAAKEVLGDVIDNTDALATLKATADLGEEHRTALITEAVKAERLAGLIGDTEADVNAAKKGYEDMPLDRLKMYHKKALSMMPEGAQLDGDDANKNNTDSENGEVAKKDAGNDAFNPLKNKAVTGVAA